MRISNMGVVALLAAGALYAGLGTWQAEAACKTAICMKQAATSKSKAVASLQRTRLASARTKLKTTHLRRKTSPVGLSKVPKALPPSIANAQAALIAPDADLAKELDNNIAAVDENEVVTINGVQIAAGAQLNDMDRAVAEQQVEIKAEEGKPDAMVAQAEPDTPPTGRILRALPSGEQQVLAKAETETWNKTSLIGKIFVAFGSLMTLASAARLMLA